MQFNKAEYKAIINAINLYVDARYKDHSFNEGDDLTGFNNQHKPIIYFFNSEKKRIWFEVTAYDERTHRWRYNVSPTNPNPPVREARTPRRAPSVRNTHTHAPPTAPNNGVPPVVHRTTQRAHPRAPSARRTRNPQAHPRATTNQPQADTPQTTPDNFALEGENW